MRPRVVLTRRALADIEAIGDRIASEGSPRRAVSFTREMRARCGDLAEFPERARLRPEHGVGVRALPFGRFLVLYRWLPERGVVRVSRVVGAAQRPLPVP